MENPHEQMLKSEEQLIADFLNGQIDAEKVVGYLRRLKEEGNGMENPIQAFMSLLIEKCQQNNKNISVYVSQVVAGLL